MTFPKPPFRPISPAAPPAPPAPAPLAPSPMARSAPPATAYAPRLFAGVGNAAVQEERGRYIQPGSYHFRVLRCVFKNTQNSGPAFIAEMDPLASDHPDFQPGSKHVSFFVKMSRQAVALSNIKNFVLAILGVTPRDVEALAAWEHALESILDQAIGEGQILSGCEVLCYAEHATTKEGHPYTRVTFSPHETGPAQAERIAQALGGAS